MAEPDKWIVLTAIGGIMAGIAALLGIPMVYKKWRAVVRAEKVKIQKEAVSEELEKVVKEIMPPIIKDIVDDKIDKSNADNEKRRNERSKGYVKDLKSIHETNRNLAKHIIKVKDTILGEDGLLVRQSVLETKLVSIAENCIAHKNKGA